MRRMILLFMMATLVVTMMVANVAPAFAETRWEDDDDVPLAPLAPPAQEFTCWWSLDNPGGPARERSDVNKSEADWLVEELLALCIEEPPEDDDDEDFEEAP